MFGGTALMYAFRERERILDMFEMLCGARITLSYMRIGGVLQDAPEEFWPALRSFMNDMPGYADELQALVFDSEIVRSRSIGVAPVSAADAIAASFTGPILRASGVAWDWRKSAPYDVYDRVEFDVPTCEGGDNYDRFWVRMLEVRESLRIIEQCCEQIEPGPVRATMAMLFRPPPGEAYVPIEAPKGRVGLLPRERRHDSAVPLPRALSIFHEPDVVQGDARGVEAGGRHRDAGQPRLQHGRG